MSSEHIYLAARDCAVADQFNDQTVPIYWHGKANFIDQLRAGYNARMDVKAAARAAEERKPRH
jgi:hypothetical protein